MFQELQRTVGRLRVVREERTEKLQTERRKGEAKAVGEGSAMTAKRVLVSSNMREGGGVGGGGEQSQHQSCVYVQYMIDNKYVYSITFERARKFCPQLLLSYLMARTTFKNSHAGNNSGPGGGAGASGDSGAQNKTAGGPPLASSVSPPPPPPPDLVGTDTVSGEGGNSSSSTTTTTTTQEEGANEERQQERFGQHDGAEGVLPSTATTSSVAGSSGPSVLSSFESSDSVEGKKTGREGSRLNLVAQANAKSAGAAVGGAGHDDSHGETGQGGGIVSTTGPGGGVTSAVGHHGAAAGAAAGNAEDEETTGQKKPQDPVSEKAKATTGRGGREEASAPLGGVSAAGLISSLVNKLIAQEGDISSSGSVRGGRGKDTASSRKEEEKNTGAVTRGEKTVGAFFDARADERDAAGAGAHLHRKGGEGDGLMAADQTPPNERVVNDEEVDGIGKRSVLGAEGGGVGTRQEEGVLNSREKLSVLRNSSDTKERGLGEADREAGSFNGEEEEGTNVHRGVLASSKDNTTNAPSHPAATPEGGGAGGGSCTSAPRHPAAAAPPPLRLLPHVCSHSRLWRVSGCRVNSFS